MISIELAHLLANFSSTFQPMIEFNRAVYIRNPAICLMLVQVFSCPLQAINLHKGMGHQPVWHISVVSHSLVIYLIYTPKPEGHRREGVGVHIRQITWAHDTTIKQSMIYSVNTLFYLKAFLVSLCDISMIIFNSIVDCQY